ncbi:MAG: DoxX family membrane protein [Ignavibacteria bacterium]|nr:DoxX family membrane protein [Ignavibacteria bacterium]
MKDFLSSRYVQVVLQIIIGAVFVYASYNKLFDQAAFAKSVYGYKLLPDFLINITAIIVPPLEFIAGLFLMFGLFRKGSSLVIIALLSVFLIGLVQAYARGLDIDCGCFGSNGANKTTSADLLIRIFEDILLLLGAIIIFKFSRSKYYKNVNYTDAEILASQNKET